jgi:hypothetical protein
VLEKVLVLPAVCCVTKKMFCRRKEASQQCSGSSSLIGSRSCTVFYSGLQRGKDDSGAW